MQKLKIYLSLLLVSSMFAMYVPQVHASGTWTQTDWSGGAGQTNWSVTNQYNTSSGINSSAANQIKITANPINVSQEVTLPAGWANFISLPYYNSYVNAVGLFNLISNVSAVKYYNDLIGTSYAWNGTRGINFNITSSGSLINALAPIINVSLTVPFTIIGQDQPGETIQLHAAALGDGQNISLPFHLAATNAEELFADIPNVTAVKIWDNASGTWFIYDGSTNLNNFPITPGMAVTVTVSQDTTWTPTFNPSSITYPASATLTSSTYTSTTGDTTWGPLSYNATLPANTSISFEYSGNGGTTWQTITDPANQSLGTSQTMTYRVTLSNTDGISTPILRSVSIAYTTATGGGGLAGGLPITPSTTTANTTTTSGNTTNNPLANNTPANSSTTPNACQPGDKYDIYTGLPCTTTTATTNAGQTSLSITTSTNSCTITETLKQGSKGNDVKCLQRDLTITQDGLFGPKTKQSVISFQKDHNLTPDGIVGPKTRAVLNQ